MKPLDDTLICVFASMARSRTMASDAGSSRGAMMELFAERLMLGDVDKIQVDRLDGLYTLHALDG